MRGRGIVVAKERFVCCQMSGIRKELMKREKTETGGKKLEESGGGCEFI